MKLLTTILTGLCALTLGNASLAAEFGTNIPMRVGGATTFYVKGSVGTLEEMDFMVDTGSGFMTINEETLADLQRFDQATYLRELRGVLANGAEMVVPVYRLSHFKIGSCMLNNVEAAVFPGNTRQILGLSALKQASPFIFSMDPPNLALSNCTKPEVLASSLKTTAVVD